MADKLSFGPKKTYVLCGLILLTIVFLASVVVDSKNKNLDNIQGFAQIRLEGKIILEAKIVSTEKDRNRGLSGTAYLGEDQGMLFVFDIEGKHGFWMKDMKFPIDIVWLSKDKYVVHIESRVSPLTYPKVFYPVEKATYVIETNAGFFENKNIKIGQKLEF